MSNIQQIVRENVERFIFEGMQSWKYNDEIDQAVNFVDKQIKSKGYFNDKIEIDGHRIHISYPTDEEYFFSTPNGDMELDYTEESYSPYDLKATLFHELEHIININTLQRKYSRLGVNYQADSLKIDIDYYDNNPDDEIFQKEWKGYEDVETDESIRIYVEDILYRLWNIDERDAHMADYVENPKLITQTLTELSIIKKNSLPKLQKHDLAMEKFWLVVGQTIMKHRKQQYRKQNTVIHSLNAFQAYKYFIKKTEYLYQKTLKRYDRNLLKSPQTPQWNIRSTNKNG